MSDKKCFPSIKYDQFLNLNNSPIEDKASSNDIPFFVPLLHCSVSTLFETYFFSRRSAFNLLIEDKNCSLVFISHKSELLSALNKTALVYIQTPREMK